MYLFPKVVGCLQLIVDIIEALGFACPREAGMVM
jgi:hypothetical protein